MNELPYSPEEQPAKSWLSTSITVKMIIIAALALLMLIPANLVQPIISERENTGRSVETEVEKAWAGNQQIAGPVLTVPYVKISPKGEKQYHNKHFLPQQLDVTGKLSPEKLERSIYEITVYDAALNVNGNFDVAAIQSAQFDGTPLWENAYLSIAINDLSGVQNALNFKLDNEQLPIKSGLKSKILGESGVTLPIDLTTHFFTNWQFNFDLQVKGTSEIAFLPIGNSTSVNLSSPWNAPGFNGAFSPDNKSIQNDGFTAQWDILELNRNYPQMWDDDAYTSQLQESAFGVDLVNTTNDYQKAMRSVKYAILTIGLTFLVFFLVEIINGNRIHPFQYILVGLALSLFYVLLISISEHIDFNIAYLIAAAVIVTMITLYSLAVFSQKKLSVLLFFILSGLYGFLFVILQANDYALLLGSIGLVIMLALTMYLTRKINWYQVKAHVA
ncbi:MAG: cell envelope integrity protein CreD [Bacteroidetes bacterium]|jgi:inner membrane protein|nr:cell envelope integrity protein CreD [Bacteroidota bacterium]